MFLHTCGQLEIQYSRGGLSCWIAQCDYTKWQSIQNLILFKANLLGGSI